MVGNDWENRLKGPNSSKSLPNCPKMSQNVPSCPKMSQNVPKCPLQTHRCPNGLARRDEDNQTSSVKGMLELNGIIAVLSVITR